MTNNRPTTPAETRSREELTDLVAAGVRPKYLLFWGHRPQPGGGTGPGALSQWWPSPFVVDGVSYPTAEHWMMAGKARMFGDEQIVPRILEARTPAEAKALGRQVAGFDEERWTAERFALVVEGSVAKFGQDGALLSYLLGTSQRVLVEASPVDRIWGVGLAADHEDVTRPARWRGLNLLGFALMAARARLSS
ncbi:NADAR family protein [Kitasatospora sp. NBC_00240]|uniref:NADAR family protein n=1 Tax=Kitasatospora sp. NBC_00240 TaxID=2903567 RepID=UPI0022562564|nr:NADAR family protein [Kitasatospora sp. NBC_00240]MCX5213044.1 NADAR family protein [Kitasatospora sp. NBC_00240]